MSRDADALAGLTQPQKKLDHTALAKVIRATFEQGANFYNGASSLANEACNQQRPGTLVFDHTSVGHDVRHSGCQLPAPAEVLLHAEPEGRFLCRPQHKGAYDPVTITPQGQPAQIRAVVDERLRIPRRSTCSRWRAWIPRCRSRRASRRSRGWRARAGSGAVGLSEVSEEAIRRAAEVPRIAAVETEFSLFSTEPLDDGTVGACHERISLSILREGLLPGLLTK